MEEFKYSKTDQIQCPHHLVKQFKATETGQIQLFIKG